MGRQPLSPETRLAVSPPPQAALDRLALLLAASQPTYPLYVWYLAGGDWWISFGTSLSAVPFALVPTIARSWPPVGRWAVPVIGTANTLFGVVLFGLASGVTWLLVPCAVITAMSGVRRAIPWALVWLASSVIISLILPGPLGRFGPEGLAALNRLNLGSALLLCPIAWWMLGR